ACALVARRHTRLPASALHQRSAVLAGLPARTVGARSRGCCLMPDKVKAPAGVAPAEGLGGFDPATSEIGPEHNATNGKAQAALHGNADVSIPKYIKRRRTKSAITGLRAAIKELLERSHHQTI